MYRPKLEVLSKEDTKAIIEAAYDFLEDFGVMVDNEEALSILADAGAKVDLGSKTAYIPAHMIDKALETAPSSFTVYDREGNNPVAMKEDNNQ